MTLVCHHPELVNNTGRYFDTRPSWTENGRVVLIIDGAIYSAETLVNLSLSFLRINITMGHFRNQVFNYSCEFVLADVNGRPTSSVGASRIIIVDPVGECGC